MNRRQLLTGVTLAGVATTLGADSAERGPDRRSSLRLAQDRSIVPVQLVYSESPNRPPEAVCSVVAEGVQRHLLDRIGQQFRLQPIFPHAVNMSVSSAQAARVSNEKAFMAICTEALDSIDARYPHEAKLVGILAEHPGRSGFDSAAEGIGERHAAVTLYNSFIAKPPHGASFPPVVAELIGNPFVMGTPAHSFFHEIMHLLGASHSKRRLDPMVGGSNGPQVGTPLELPDQWEVMPRNIFSRGELSIGSEPGVKYSLYLTAHPSADAAMSARLKRWPQHFGPPATGQYPVNSNQPSTSPILWEFRDGALACRWRTPSKDPWAMIIPTEIYRHWKSDGKLGVPLDDARLVNHGARSLLEQSFEGGTIATAPFRETYQMLTRSPEVQPS